MEEDKIERLFNVKAVVEILGSPRPTVIGWIREGRLRAFKLPGGRLWRVRESELARFMNDSKGGDR